MTHDFLGTLRAWLLPAACALSLTACGDLPGMGGDTDPDGGVSATPDSGIAVLPSSLAVNCAVRENQKKKECERALSWAPGSLGTGPTIAGTRGFPSLKGGFVDGNKAIAAVTLGVSGSLEIGVVMAVDLDTGNRTVISGEYEETASGAVVVGTGPKMGQVLDTQKGPDGYYASGTKGVFRIDPATGNRTVVYDAEKRLPACKITGGEALKPFLETFAVGSDGTVYLYANHLSFGQGLLAIKGTSCTPTTWYSDNETWMKGSGVQMGGKVRGLRFQDGKVYGLEFTSSSLYTVDVANGKRTRISSSSNSSKLGAGDVILTDAFIGFKNATTAVVTGMRESTIRVTEVDLATGNRTPQPKFYGPISNGQEQTPGIWVHPTKPLYIVGMDEAFVLYEPSTGNSNTLSR